MFLEFRIPSKALASKVKCAGVAPQAYKGVVKQAGGMFPGHHHKMAKVFPNHPAVISIIY